MSPVTRSTRRDPSTPRRKYGVLQQSDDATPNQEEENPPNIVPASPVTNEKIPTDVSFLSPPLRAKNLFRRSSRKKKGRSRSKGMVLSRNKALRHVARREKPSRLRSHVAVAAVTLMVLQQSHQPNGDVNARMLRLGGSSTDSASGGPWSRKAIKRTHRADADGRPTKRVRREKVKSGKKVEESSAVGSSLVGDFLLSSSITTKLSEWRHPLESSSSGKSTTATTASSSTRGSTPKATEATGLVPFIPPLGAASSATMSDLSSALLFWRTGGSDLADIPSTRSRMHQAGNKISEDFEQLLQSSSLAIRASSEVQIRRALRILGVPIRTLGDWFRKAKDVTGTVVKHLLEPANPSMLALPTQPTIKSTEVVQKKGKTKPAVNKAKSLRKKKPNLLQRLTRKGRNNPSNKRVV